VAFVIVTSGVTEKKQSNMCVCHASVNADIIIAAKIRFAVSNVIWLMH